MLILLSLLACSNELPIEDIVVRASLPYNSPTANYEPPDIWHECRWREVNPPPGLTTTKCWVCILGDGNGEVGGPVCRVWE